MSPTKFRAALYFAIAFSMSVEVLNLLAAARRRRKHDAELDRLRGESSEAAQ